MTHVLLGGHAGLAVELGGVGATLEGLLTIRASLAKDGRARPLRWANCDPEPPENRAQMLTADVAWQVANILSGLSPPPSAPETGLAYKNRHFLW